MAPAVPEEKNTGRQLATCSPRRDCDGGVWHCVSQRRAECKRRVQDTVHHSQEIKQKPPNSPPGKNSCVNTANLADFFSATASLLHLVVRKIAPGHNIVAHNRCFDTSYMREKNRKDELTQAQGIIQEQEGKKERKSPSPSPSKVANQGAE